MVELLFLRNHLNDKRHRTDGPAVDYTNGYIKYCVEGIDITDQVIELVKEGLSEKDAIDYIRL